MYEVVIPLDEEPYERILTVDASPEPGKRPSRSGPGYGATPGIYEVRFSEDDPVPEDRGTEVSAKFFDRHEDTIARQVLQLEERRHAEPRPCRF